MYLVITGKNDAVVNSTPTNLKTTSELGVISVGKMKKYLVLDKDAPKVGEKFNVKKALMD